MPSRHPYFRVCALGLILLGSLLYSINTDYVWVTGMRDTLNDQVGYVSVARTFSETGELRSRLIYPSLLNQNKSKNYPYMPGHYFALASSYLVFGYSPLASFLPNLIAYLISACALLYVCRRFLDEKTGTLSVILLMTFPATLIYSFTAMAEMTFVAAGMVAMALFVWLPAERRPYLGPILLLLPVLFRETGAVLLIPMTAILIKERSVSWKRDASVMIGLSLVLFPLLAFVLFGDRPSFLKMNLMGAALAEKYQDAFSVTNVVLSSGDWIGLLGAKTLENLSALFAPGLPTPVEVGCLWFMLGSIPVGLFVSARKRSLLLLSFTATTTVVFLTLLATYKLWDFVGVRNLMICLPFIAILYAELLLSLIRPEHQRALLIGVLLVGVITGIVGTRSVFDSQETSHRREKTMTGFLEFVGHDDDRLLVSPFWMSLPYVSTHHPVRWSFIPANGETLRLLGERYDIGTLVIPFGHHKVKIERDEVLAAGYRLIAKYRLGQAKFSVFRLPESPG
jgi:hypothetical protein